MLRMSQLTTRLGRRSLASVAARKAPVVLVSVAAGVAALAGEVALAEGPPPLPFESAVRDVEQRKQQKKSGSGSGSGSEAKSAEEEQAKEKLPFPGQFEQMSQLANGVFMMFPWVGARMNLVVPVVQSNEKQFAVQHQFELGPKTEENQHGAVYKFVPQVQFPSVMLMGEYAPATSIVSGSFAHMTGKYNTRIQFQAAPPPPGQEDNMPFGMHAELEGRFASTGVVIAANARSEVLAMMLQSITKNLAIGAHLHTNYDKQLSTTTLAARWRQGLETDNKSGSDFVINANTDGVLSMTYAQRVNPKVVLAAKFDYMPRSSDPRQMMEGCSASVGYQYASNNFHYRSTLNDQGTVQMVLDTMIAPTLKFSLCGKMQHAAQVYDFGFGLEIG